MSELWQLSAAQLVEGYRSGAFTPMDALEACLARVAQCQPLLNAMVQVDSVGARLAAQASCLRWASAPDGPLRPLGPLDGVPVSIKDNLHVAGLPTTWGSRLLDGFVPQRDELPVARLRAAGAVLFGKTNLPEFAMQGYTANAVAGTTRNPWHLALTPGGSSGGAAAAVAAGCGPLALATDGGGSIRRPASHCGLVGFKPSAARVPREGGLPEIFLDYEVTGAIGRTVEDVRSLVEVLSAMSLEAPAPQRARILFVPHFAAHPVDSGIAALVREAAGHFALLGHRVEEAPGFDLAEPVNALWPTLSAAGLAWMLGDTSRWPEFGQRPHATSDENVVGTLGGAIRQAPDFSLCSEAAQASLREGRLATGTGMFGLLAKVQALKSRLDTLFTKHNFILTPATAALPWPAEQTHPPEIDGQTVGPRGHAVFTAFANAAGLPAVALPCGWVRGLPTGFQLVGQAGADAALLALAQQYEQARPWAARWPEIPSLPEKAETP